MGAVTDAGRVYAVTLFVLLAGSAVAVGLSGGESAEVPTPSADTEVNTTADGTRYTVHPDRLRQGCPGGTDC
ncbi:MAG: hypothetical protein ABEH77_07005, partial [Halobacteriaceae archaeon]